MKFGYDPSRQEMVAVLTFEPRFVREWDLPELSNLWRLSRTATSGLDCSRYRRMLWASEAFAKDHPYVTATGAYKDLDDMLSFGRR